jgi:sialate O-acetylesterase
MSCGIRVFSLAALVVAFCAPCQADVALPAVFGDHMVLQRDLPIPVWGRASPGEQVQVTCAGQSKQATATVRGRWRVTLDPLPAGGPWEFIVQGSNVVRFHGRPRR